MQIHAPGQLIEGRYEINAFIGEGGMQQVYLARDTRLSRDVALKVPKNPSAEKRFKRSASLSARVTHPNVAKTLDYFEASSNQYLIEEFIAGSDLQKRWDSDFIHLDPYLASHFIHHAVRAVAASHRVDVVHRDLKPSNIMVSDDADLRVLKITDFGIAKMAEEELAAAVSGGESTITTSQTMFGAIPYMSPEMITDPRTAGKPADVWALGAMLYQMLSGNPPYGRGLPAVPKILTQPLPPRPTVCDKAQFQPLLSDLWTLCESCLVKDPSQRPTAEALVSECGRLCYSTAPRSVGYVRQYGRGNGAWGFINSGGDVFFHWDSVYGASISSGLRVSFTAFGGGAAPRAHPVLPLK